MKLPLLCVSFSIILVVGFSTLSIAGRAEAHCPANVAGIRTRPLAEALLVIPVKINRAGPFDFIVDTGSQLNVIDPALAGQLGVKSQGKIGLVTVATVFQVPVVVLDSLETGSLSIARPVAAVEDLEPIQSLDRRIRGVLGENFLAHFDVLIDYSHRLLCLDQANLMQSALRGERIPLVTSEHTDTPVPFSERLAIAVNLSDTGSRPIHLQIDSGSDGPILYASKKELVFSLLKRAKLQGPEVSEARRAFAILPPQDMKLGTRTLPKVHFATPAGTPLYTPVGDEDGILATVLFQRVYISHSGQFVIFDPK